MPFEPLDLLWLLLPLAAASGWLAARRDAEKKAQRSSQLPSGYFRGVNHLLNEQPDKAIELFTRMLEINTETVETHLALGSLFRRRGEVDRAIRIHQNLMARPTLAQEYRTLALYELAQDYLKAGLLDRAEGLFLELCETREHAESAMRSLLQIYEQEKDWGKAITIAQRLSLYSGESSQALLAQYQCELAEQQIQNGNQHEAGGSLARAMQIDPHCVRARLLSGRLSLARGAWREAIQEWQSIERHDPAYMEEIVEDLSDVYQRLDDEQGLELYLFGLLQRQPGERTLLALAEVMTRRGAVREARQQVREYLRRQPSTRVLAWLVAQPAGVDGPAIMQDELITAALDRLSETRHVYQCGRCGYRGTALHWQCPACHAWDKTRPASRRGAEQDKPAAPAGNTGNKTSLSRLLP
jgi:lipopolysaccharide assembly protein B